ncbi:MAG: hypothetical protein IJH07_02205 [Ruminococcus sp.]|nr:hypothetical protein [Ruminococcus sp.]
MKNTWLADNSFEYIKAALSERGYDLGEMIGEGRGSIVFSLINNSTLGCKIRPYSKEAVKRILFARAAYQFDKKRFPYLPIPDPNRKIEFVLNSDELTDESKDWEIEPIITKERAFLATIHERLSPIRSMNERELLKLTIDIAEALDKMYDPLRFSLHGIGKGDILFSHLIDRYVIADCDKVSRFIDNDLRYRYGDPRTSAPELNTYHYYESSSVFSLGFFLRKLVTRGINPEDEMADKLDKINSAIRPAVIQIEKMNLEPLDDTNSKYSRGFIRLINRMTSYYPEDRPSPKQTAEAARKLREMPSHLREEIDI